MTTPTLIEPAAQAPVVEKADFIEYQAWVATDGDFSFAEYTSDIRRSGSMEMFEEADADSSETLVDSGGEESEMLVNDVYVELADRAMACGESYPFELDANYLERRAEGPYSPYLFMLLFSLFGDCGPAEIKITKLFEQVSCEAALSYFGGSANAQMFPFGAPRRDATPAGFAAAVDALCAALNEGGGIRAQDNLRDQKDAKLDLVVWRNFPDRRSGQLIGFGQCATGKDWKGKVTELRSDSFCKTWMRDMPVVDPVRLFFVPFRLSTVVWQSVANDGGIVFDRCRIAHHLDSISAEVLEQCEAWCDYVLSKQGAG
jgi:hypothetical protein